MSSTPKAWTTRARQDSTKHTDDHHRGQLRTRAEPELVHEERVVRHCRGRRPQAVRAAPRAHQAEDERRRRHHGTTKPKTSIKPWSTTADSASHQDHVESGRAAGTAELEPVPAVVHGAPAGEQNLKPVTTTTRVTDSVTPSVPTSTPEQPHSTCEKIPAHICLTSGCHVPHRNSSRSTTAGAQAEADPSRAPDRRRPRARSSWSRASIRPTPTRQRQNPNQAMSRPLPAARPGPTSTSNPLRGTRPNTTAANGLTTSTELAPDAEHEHQAVADQRLRESAGRVAEHDREHDRAGAGRRTPQGDDDHVDQAAPEPVANTKPPGEHAVQWECKKLHPH